MKVIAKRATTVFLFSLTLPMVGFGAEERSETITEMERRERRTFCSTKDEGEAAALCQKWLDAQKLSLKNRLLTSHCSTGSLGELNCLYKAEGELTYVLEERRKETRK